MIDLSCSSNVITNSAKLFPNTKSSTLMSTNLQFDKILMFSFLGNHCLSIDAWIANIKLKVESLLAIRNSFNLFVNLIDRINKVDSLPKSSSWSV